MAAYRPPAQPAKGALTMASIPQTRVAREAGCSRYWAHQVLNGRVRPPEKFRRVVAALLGMPESELFYDWDDEPAGATR